MSRNRKPTKNRVHVFVCVPFVFFSFGYFCFTGFILAFVVSFVVSFVFERRVTRLGDREVERV